MLPLQGEIIWRKPGTQPVGLGYNTFAFQAIC